MGIDLLPSDRALHGFPIPAPTVDEDQFGFVYDDATEAFVWQRPQGEVAYAEATGDQASINTIVDLTGLTLTFDVVDRPVWVVGYVPYWVATNSASKALLSMRDGANGFQGLAYSFPAASASDNISTPAIMQRITTPGTYTRKLSAQRTLGSGTVTMKATPEIRAFIRVST